MKNLRLFGTGAAIITFALIALSGVGLFFGVRAGVIKTAHEWIGLAMVVATLAHIVANWRGFLGYFKGAKAAAIVLPVVILLAAWGYSTTLPKPTNWKKGKAYEKLVNMRIDHAIMVFEGDVEAFNDFLHKKGLKLEGEITIKELAKTNDIKENEILDAIIK